MASGDKIVATSGSSYRQIHNDNKFPTLNDWQYFTGTKINLHYEDRTFGYEIYLDRNTGSNTSPTWTRVWTYSGNGPAESTRTLDPGQLPSWRIVREKSGAFIGNPEIRIRVYDWHGTKDYPVYYYHYVSSLSSSYVNPQYKTNSGLSITWARRLNMSH